MTNSERARETAESVKTVIHNSIVPDQNTHDKVIAVILSALNGAATHSFERRLMDTVKYAHKIKKLAEALSQIAQRLEFVDPNINLEASNQNIAESLGIANKAVSKYAIEEVGEAIAEKRPLLLYLVRENEEVVQIPEAKEDDYADLLSQITDLNEVAKETREDLLKLLASTDETVALHSKFTAKYRGI